MGKKRTGLLTDLDTPRKGEEVIDPILGRGVVVRQPLRGGLWISFKDDEGVESEPILYTFRRSLNEWRMVMGHASRPGLRM